MYYNNKRITKTISGMMVPSWWAVKMLTKMRWWQRMGKRAASRRVPSPATFPKTFLSIIRVLGILIYSDLPYMHTCLIWKWLKNDLRNIVCNCKIRWVTQIFFEIIVYNLIIVDVICLAPNCRMFKQNELDE